MIKKVGLPTFFVVIFLEKRKQRFINSIRLRKPTSFRWWEEQPTSKNCGYKSNDDCIGAMNLYRMGINYLEDSVVPNTVTSE